ncbi:MULTISPECIES: cellulose biosynthesis protein BcsG [Legionella]|uniref:Cellulose biosynthesis protein BcsG n=1 Tax=Legionella resiliens TaxID=2905958 RepID=A0ABS8X604_9GAMM|nr:MULTISPECIES: cellulose biosynthesis protein BcsG [unclassified Legionella]MCE0723121.1 cellulose biosynthesis protein BcsG [Legionella sp. 9fVS26]MCE3532274.1 cellulose biosynthesis protein BcsG [Legionella sp. 8cVS16]QLZ68403.1 cellulose biosynthesis protein BcsG [Legionella sp. PC1000]
MIETVQVREKIPVKWRDINGWNYYFLLKFALLWGGYLNFHPFVNLVFLAFLLFPLPSIFLHRCRNWIAIPIGIVLFYHDTWLPGLSSIMSQGTNLFAFSSNYLLELLNRFINWQLIGMAFILLVAYLFLSQWIRITTFTVIALVWLNILTLRGPAINLLPIESKTATTKVQVGAETTLSETAELNSKLPPTNENLNTYLNQFYEQQQGLHTIFPSSLPADALPFDIIFIQVCSLAWADIDAVHLRDHPIWSKFDILFNQFNSAASYSGPAAIRLLRASCGETSHAGLYKPVAQDCYILDNLAKLGFSTEMMLDHEGEFGNFLKEIKEYGGLDDVPLMSRAGIRPDLVSFDGKLLSDDSQLLDKWIKQQKDSGKKHNATYFNEISLHDGNTFIGENTPAPYEARAKKLLDQTMNFFTALENSGRKVVVVFIPEHGANLVGDKLQMPGLRDIPSPAITHVPVGIKFIGLKAKPAQIQINAPSSYLAISELIARLVDGKIFNQEKVNLDTLTKNLPKTPFISSNEGVTVMKYQDKFYILLKGDNNWVPYP